MTEARKEAKTALPLKRMPYIHYSLRFKKDWAKIQVLIYFGSKVNLIAPTYAAKLGLNFWPTNIRG